MRPVPKRLGNVTMLAAIWLMLGSVLYVPDAVAQDVDVTPPRYDTNAGNPPGGYHEFFVRFTDTESGIASFSILNLRNVSVTVEPFTPGTTSPVVVNVDSINHSRPIAFAVTARDVAGNDLTVLMRSYLAETAGGDQGVEFYGAPTARYLDTYLPNTIERTPINGSTSIANSVRRSLLTAVRIASALQASGQNELACLQLSSLELQIRSQVAKRRIAANDTQWLYDMIAAARLGTCSPPLEQERHPTAN